jgi:serine/threonine-protein kinase
VALEHYKTQILLLHSQQSTLDNLSSGFNERYSVHCATTGSEALSTLGETPIHVIVSAQDLPGMSGLEALREAKKRSPDTIGILLAGRDQSDGLEALVGDKEVFQIVRGEISPEALRNLIDAATKRARLIALSESANDTAANVDEPVGEHIIMETSENGSAIVSDGTGSMPALKPQKIQIGGDAGSRGIDILVLTKDEEFLATIKDSARGLHKVFHAVTPQQAEGYFKDNKIGVLVTDAAMVGSSIETMTHRMRTFVPRLVAIVAGRRDDGELLMDLINRGQVYRFLLKPVSPGRARLAIEASVKHHLEAAENAFKPASGKEPPVAAATIAPQARPLPKAQARKVTPMPKATSASPQAAVAATATRKTPTISGSPLDDGLNDAFGDDSSFTETMTGIALTIGKSLTGGNRKTQDAAPSANRGDPAESRGMLAALLTPKFLIAGFGLLLLLIAGSWLFSGPDTGEEPAVAETPAAQRPDPSPAPRIVDSEPAALPPTDPGQIAAPSYEDLLDEARIARTSGEIIAPPGSNAIELYIAAREAAPDNVVITQEMDELVNQVLGMAESALLAQNTTEADFAISKVRLASPDNPRLPFLDAQLAQQKLRRALDDARAAIRENRFEDAAKQLANARSVQGVDLAAVRVLSEELAKARSMRKIDEVLTLAATRLDEDKLISPANDNARYYYELALGSDANNTSAQQGLVIVASKLVLKARAAIDNDLLDQAGDLLRNAEALDPGSNELAAASDALQTAIQAEAEAARRAEANRLAEIERQAEAERLAATRRQAEQERLAEAQRQISTGQAAAATPGKVPADNGRTPAPVAESANLESTPGNAAGDAARVNAETALAAAARKMTPNQAVTATSPQPGRQTIEMVGVNTLNRTRYVSPKYPRNAMRRDITGYVDVSMTIAVDGSVYDITILDAKPEGTFDDAAIEAVQQWRFDPVIENGRPTEKRTAVRMAFELQ